MEFKNNTYFVDDFLRTHKSKVSLGYVALSGRFTDEQNKLILQGVKEFDERTQSEINKQREKLELKARMHSDITKIVYSKGWKCLNCRADRKKAKTENKIYKNKIELQKKLLDLKDNLISKSDDPDYVKNWQRDKHIEIKKNKERENKFYKDKLSLEKSILSLHDVPLHITEKKKEFICPVCSAKVILNFIKCANVILIRINTHKH